MNRLKTARYTFSLPFMLASKRAKTSQTEQSQLEQLGECIGLLYQVRDDELNLFGDSKSTGKPVGSDIRERKKTLYYIYLLNATSEMEKQQLYLTDPSHPLDDAIIEKILTLIKEKKIQENVRVLMHPYYQKATEIIKQLPDAHHHFYTELLEFTITRNK